MSRSATPATRNEATRRRKPPKMTTSAELTIGTDIRSSHERLRTFADGWATSSEHTLNSQTPRVKREPLLRIREKQYLISKKVLSWKNPKIKGRWRVKVYTKFMPRTRSNKIIAKKCQILPHEMPQCTSQKMSSRIPGKTQRGSKIWI